MSIKLILAAQNSITENSLQTIKKNTNVFQRLWAGIDWDQIVSKVIVATLTIIALTVLFFILNKVGKRIIKHVFDRYAKNEKFSVNRVGTIRSLINNLYTYLLIFFYVYAILSTLGVPVGTLIAGAGILSLAIGLGAQGFVNDLVTGLFILVEQQFDVGDVVKIGTITGTIHAIGLRTTQVKSFDGTLNFIPNRNITIVSNKSRGNRQVLLNIRIYPQTDISQLKKIIEQVNQKLVPRFDTIRQGPDLLGVNDLGHGELAYQVQMYTINGDELTVQREFLAAYLAAFKANQIDLPQTPLDLNFLAPKA
ncbi:mechanosensitive ion channel family protein [Lactobacillus sp. CC-MHH1034]|uniref:mechanosensitive ion channel family protein n=1 Tax=Agrilactobacillus fermenti TaxID=2586909 RepID=UPI001E319F6B|nr:mechanosensitive ion channel family protein [Agrilactobacillus fermenti]MCD2256796.1 mechanosensitive ion channel family protein [Agrilactobacillus fermenti]